MEVRPNQLERKPASIALHQVEMLGENMEPCMKATRSATVYTLIFAPDLLGSRSVNNGKILGGPANARAKFRPVERASGSSNVRFPSEWTKITSWLFPKNGNKNGN